MLAADDHRWSTLIGGYRSPLDPRPLVEELEKGTDTSAAWSELWDELHHQGDVGDASYAAVPLLVECHKRRGVADWNPYAIVSIIELARTEDNNPPIPAWLSDDYFNAIQHLSRIGIREIADTDDPDAVRALLALVALAKGLRTHAKFLINYSDSELLEIESEALE